MNPSMIDFIAAALVSIAGLIAVAAGVQLLFARICDRRRARDQQRQTLGRIREQGK